MTNQNRVFPESHVITENNVLFKVLGDQICRWMSLFRKSWRGHTGS